MITDKALIHVDVLISWNSIFFWFPLKVYSWIPAGRAEEFPMEEDDHQIPLYHLRDFFIHQTAPWIRIRV